MNENLWVPKLVPGDHAEIFLLLIMAVVNFMGDYQLGLKRNLS